MSTENLYIHYTYKYLDPRKENQEFYIGEGKDDRWYFHLEEAKRLIREKKSQKWIGDNCDNPHKTRTIMKILNAGLEPTIIKVLENVDKPTAITEEIRLIAYHGRADLGLGSLTNLTDGGDGLIGFIWSEEQKAKLKGRTNSMLGRNHTDESKQKMSDFHTGKTLSEEHKKKIGESLKGKSNIIINKKIYSKEEVLIKYATRRGKSEAKSKARLEKFEKINPHLIFNCGLCGKEINMRLKEKTKRLEKYGIDLCNGYGGCSFKFYQRKDSK